LYALLITFLLYLPLLCFSGLEVLVHNHYNAPMQGKTFVTYAQWVYPYAGVYLPQIFSDIHWHHFSFNLILFLLPLLLLFAGKNKVCFLAGLFYLVMWLVVVLLVLVMKALPFERNLAAQFSLTLAGVLQAAYLASGVQKKDGKAMLLRAALFCAVPVFFIVHFVQTNKLLLPTGLYGYDINQNYRELSDQLYHIPAGSSISFSDEAFFYYYLYEQKGSNISKCATGNEDYYIKRDYEQLPKNMEGKYAIVAATPRFYEIYKRK
jgi:hypothetical protein